MVHFGFEILAVQQFADVDMMFIWRFADELRNYAVDGRFIIIDEAIGKEKLVILQIYWRVVAYLQVIFSLASLQPLF